MTVITSEDRRQVFPEATTWQVRPSWVAVEHVSGEPVLDIWANDRVIASFWEWKAVLEGEEP